MTPAPIDADALPGIFRSLPMREDKHKILHFQWTIIKGIRISLIPSGFTSFVLIGQGGIGEEDQQRFRLFSISIDFEQL